MNDNSTPVTDAEALACRHFHNQPIDYVPLCVARKLKPFLPTPSQLEHLRRIDALIAQ